MQVILPDLCKIDLKEKLKEKLEQMQACFQYLYLPSILFNPVIFFL